MEMAGGQVTFMNLNRPDDGLEASTSRLETAPIVPTPPSEEEKSKVEAEFFGKPFKPEPLLILTPVKNAASHLEPYFRLIDSLEYPKNLISLAFLVSDTHDTTIEMLQDYADRQRHLPYKKRLSSVSIYEKDFKFILPEMDRHSYEIQPLRRSMMARARNYLLSLALRPHHVWTLWLDVDIVRTTPNILETLMRHDRDIIVPNCLVDIDAFWGYDKNNWLETTESLDFIRDLEQDFVLVEGYDEQPTYRLHLIDVATHHGPTYGIPLNGIGGTFTLVKSNVHRAGANFPSFTVDHAVETEGLARMALRMGFEVWGVPGVIVYHDIGSSGVEH
ncbi:hypothetical protein BZG36_02956 [Bifiguratus adelaidae]|uniref:Uncharacterized protein n=1 Tax=Bifiguratus adelaidae TaxID=1938954 RepID=A0A261Y0Q6_9FUNG|nr:hypothetical protein BZG36_02956 [Bifiguratus adelaidae]